MEKIYLELSTLLDNYDRRLKEKREREKEAREEEEAFLKDFRRLRSDVIKPVLEQIGSQLKDRGHDYSIEDGETTKDTEGRTLDAYIRINIFPSEAKRYEYSPGLAPFISFSAIRLKKIVMISGGNIVPKKGDPAGSREEFKIDQINEKLLSQVLLKMLKEIF
jgi:hypothetical protein